MQMSNPMPNAVPNVMSDPKVFAHISEVIKTRTMASPIYAFLLSSIVLTHASKGLVIARLVLEPCHINSGGGLHGSVSATFIDWAGGAAISSYDLRDKTGASVDIHAEYLGSAKVGDEIEIEGKADRVGGSLAFTTVGIFKIKDGQRADPLVYGRHTKFVRGTAPN